MIFQSEHNAADWTLGGPASLPGAFGRRIGTQALLNHVLILLAEVVAPPGRELRLAPIAGSLDGRLDLEQQLGQTLRPTLASDFTDGGQVAQQMGIAQAVLAVVAEVGTQGIVPRRPAEGGQNTDGAHGD